MTIQNPLYGRELSEGEAASTYQPKSPILTSLSNPPSNGGYLLSISAGTLTWTAPTTDLIPEGPSKLYFTTARAKAVITGAASTVVSNDLTPTRVVISDSSGKLSASTITVLELGYLSGVTSNIQGQLASINSALGSIGDIGALTTSSVPEDTNLYYTDARARAAITGAVSPVLTTNLTASRLLVSDTGGKVSTSNVTTVEVAYLSGVTSPIQTQLAQVGTLATTVANLTTTSVPEGNRLYFTTARATASITGAASTITTADLPLSKVLISDSNGKVATSPVTTTELSYLGGATSSLQGQIGAISTTVADLTTTAIAEGTNLYHTPARVVSSLTGAVTTIATADLTVSRALVSTASGKVSVSSVTSIELGYLSGLSSGLQAQLNSITGRTITAGSGLSGGGTLSGNVSLGVVFEATPSTLKPAGTASVGTANTVPRADHVHPLDTTKVDVSLMGAAGGVATLDTNTKVPTSQIPSMTTQVGFGGEVITVPYTGSGITIPVPIEQGGTGSTNAASALSAMGAQPAYPVLTALQTVGSLGLVVKDTANTVAARYIAVNNPLTVANASGVGGNPTISLTQGTGSGLDSDLLDGLHATAFLRVDGGGGSYSSGTQTSIRGTIGAAASNTNADITTLSAITGIGNTSSGHIVITTAGYVGMGEATPNSYGKVAIKGGAAGTATSSLALLAPDGGLNARADLALYSTFSSGTDTNVRRAADIVAGFTASSFGSEYLSLHVGGATDSKLLATERARIDASGNLLVGTTTTTTNGGDVQLSKGLTFPATQVPCSNANTLDDYKEGTWTPSLDSLTPGTGRVTNVRSALFTKVGNMVTFTAFVDMGTLGSGGSGALVINGLPYVSAAVSQAYWGVSVPYFNGVKVALVALGGTVQPGTSYILFRGWAAAVNNVPSLDFATYVQAGTAFIVTGFYYT